MARRAHRPACAARSAADPSSSPSAHDPPGFAQLLAEAVALPGVVSRCYELFHGFSVGNQLAAWSQCIRRGIPLGPIHTFAGWLSVDRHVKRGEKALVLCMPVTWTPQRAATDDSIADADDKTIPVTRRAFVWRAHWFTLAQTDGADYTPLHVPQWDEAVALSVLRIERVPYRSADGNAQGYAFERKVAVSPIAQSPHRTLMHEIAHVVLGHTAELSLVDTTERTPRDLREVEAEATAYLVCQSLQLDDGLFSRGYLQHWLGSHTIDDRTARRVFHAADQILKAGRPAPTPSPDVPAK